MKNIYVIDDSALMRRVLSDIINKDENLQTDKYAINGLEALELLKSGARFDAIVLDINMPKLNGIELLREMRKEGIIQKVVIVSTLAKEGAKETIQALELGAFDFVTKPDSLAEAKGDLFENRLIEMLYAATNLPGKVSEDEELKRMQQSRKTTKTIKKTGVESIVGKIRHKHNSNQVQSSDKLVALACSTGGPKALQYVISFLPENLDAPVLLVQHMPEGFTLSLAKRLDELSRIKVKEAKDGEILEKGTVYIAQGGSQMRFVEKGKNQRYISISKDEEARNGLKPCADIMYESLVNSSYDEITCVVMTGMGADGTKGILQLEQTNNIYVIAQNEESCTVYGMPKAVAEAGLVDEVTELRKIADAITKHVGVR